MTSHNNTPEKAVATFKYLVVSGTDSTHVLLATNDLTEALIKRGVQKSGYFNNQIYKVVDVQATYRSSHDPTSNY